MSWTRLATLTRVGGHGIRLNPVGTSAIGLDYIHGCGLQDPRSKQTPREDSIPTYWTCLHSFSSSAHARGSNQHQRRGSKRMREEAFHVKLGYALLKQGGVAVGLLRRARKKAEKFEFEETKKKVQARVEQSKMKVKELRENIFTIPNLLTMSRLVMSPVLGYLVVTEQFLLGTVLFALAGVTDLLDGWIARNFANQQSVLGSIIDPLADKCLISILTISLTYSNLIPVSLTALIVLRDIGLVSAAFYLRYQSLPPPITAKRFFDATHATVQMKPTFISKVNTAVQLSLVGFTLVAPVLEFTDHPYLHGLWYVTAATTIMSGLSYVLRRDVFKYLQKER
ncbi:probable cardiolipin synthase (CMP-forming) [Diadema setosum]|uniref:probable cardiolipin synthase (CMP-forming) n=1 Tax=Diadema setosum TaxID=31175 RepID=UPI003B3BCA95